MTSKRGGARVGLLHLSALCALVLCLVAGCATQRDIAGQVTDPDFEWARDGFSVKAPGRDWYRLPDNDQSPNSVAFQKAEGLAFAEFTPKNVVYLKGVDVYAFGTILGEPVKDRQDKDILAAVLREHLAQSTRNMQEKIGTSIYDASLGVDCIKYQATSTLKRFPTQYGDMHIVGINGYVCLHPKHDQFAVIMQANTFATVWTDLKDDGRAAGFYRTLRFLPISSVTSGKFTRRGR